MSDAVEPAARSALDPFARLRATTPARIGLGRSGDALPLEAQLDLQEAHAAARDAVHGRFDIARIEAALAPLQTLAIRSRAPDRSVYLRRPDLGRRVHADDLALLDDRRGAFDLALVVADGLSAAAIAAHATPTVGAIVAALPEWRLAPIVLVREGRVAIGDEIGERLGAAFVAVLIGERPGLTVADSLGLYATLGPRVGRADSERNCISNIHARGLAYDRAAELLAAIARQGRALGHTGVRLKLDETALIAR